MMNEVRSIKNQYLGINAHLHSYWQNEGGWDEFHAGHIIYLANALKVPLLPMGYMAGVQQSLQIRRLDSAAGRPESDVLIYDIDSTRQYRSTLIPQGGHGLTVLPVPELLDVHEQDVEEYKAIGIYRFAPQKRERGEPVVWIELLSPSNKPGGQDAGYYREKVLKLLQSGIVFIEIDYLHESAPTFPGIPNYRAAESGGGNDYGNGRAGHLEAHPYRIIVIDPRPTLMQGIVRLYQFDVDEELPVVDIPLQGGDLLAFDFGASYQRTVEESMFGLEIDYRNLPQGFQRYRAGDRTRIAARMLAVLQAARDGIDLNTGPFPVKPVPLETALAELKEYGGQSDSGQ